MNDAQSQLSRPPRVLAVVLNWNSGTDTLACLDALQRSTYPAVTPVVVDNGSADDSVALVRRGFPAVRVVELGGNYGYAGGNNRGIAAGLDDCEFIWLLNPDVLVAPDCLAQLIAAATVHPHGAMFGPLVRMRDDRERILSAGGQFVAGHTTHRAMGEIDHGQFTAPAEVDFITGCALLVRRAALPAIGMLDERFFVYVEDVDWCHRARMAGFACLMIPTALAWHPNTIARDVDSALVTYYITRNQLFMIHKHRLGMGLLARHLLRDARTLASWSLRPRWRHKGAQRRALARAVLDFARGRTGGIIGG